MSIRRISTQRLGGNSTVYVGRQGEIFYDPDNINTLRFSDGVTSGGINLSTGGGNSLTNGEYSFTLNDDGSNTVPVQYDWNTL